MERAARREFLQKQLEQKARLTVGAIAEPSALHLSAQEIERDCEVVELRLDSLGWEDGVVAFAARCPVPVLVTARGPAEGGQNALTVAQRKEGYAALMAEAAAVDVEFRDFEVMELVLAEAKQKGCVIVGSFHDFSATPEKVILEAQASPLATVTKLACLTRDLEELDRLLRHASGLPCGAVMGMGPLGSASRPLFATAGSLLNYGYLGDAPTAPGQWPAGLLKQAIAAVGA